MFSLPLVQISHTAALFLLEPPLSLPLPLFPVCLQHLSPTCCLHNLYPFFKSFYQFQGGWYGQKSLCSGFVHLKNLKFSSWLWDWCHQVIVTHRPPLMSMNVFAAVTPRVTKIEMIIPCQWIFMVSFKGNVGIWFYTLGYLNLNLTRIWSKEVIGSCVWGQGNIFYVQRTVDK